MSRNRRVSPCQSCRAPMIWTVTEATGSRMPVDVDPVDPRDVKAGFTLSGDDPPVATYMRAEDALAERATIHLSHFSTCPDRDEHRRSR